MKLFIEYKVETTSALVYVEIMKLKSKEMWGMLELTMEMNLNIEKTKNTSSTTATTEHYSNM